MHFYHCWYFFLNAHLPAYTFRRILLPLPTLIYGCTLVPISTSTPREIGFWVKFVPANEKNNGKTHYSINRNLKKNYNHMVGLKTSQSAGNAPEM